MDASRNTTHCGDCNQLLRSAFILGQVSQGIEPIWSNFFIPKTAEDEGDHQEPNASGIVAEKGKILKVTWDSIKRQQ